MPSPEENEKIMSAIEEARHQQQCQQQAKPEGFPPYPTKEVDYYRSRWHETCNELAGKNQEIDSLREAIKNLEARIETQEIAMVCMAASLKNMTRGK